MPVVVSAEAGDASRTTARAARLLLNSILIVTLTSMFRTRRLWQPGFSGPETNAHVETRNDATSKSRHRDAWILQTAQPHAYRKTHTPFRQYPQPTSAALGCEGQSS